MTDTETQALQEVRQAPATLHDAEKEMARIAASSDLMPEAYRGPEGRANAFIAFELARRLGMPLLAVAQNLHIIHGKPTWSSTFLVAAINQSRMFASALRYEEEKVEVPRLDEHGDDTGQKMVRWWAMRAYAHEHDGERVYGPWVSLQMAEDEGWLKRKGSKWQTMPELMLRYRAAAFFARSVCPELTMGFLTGEEAHDAYAGRQSTVSVTDLNRALGAIDGEAQIEGATE